METVANNVLYGIASLASEPRDKPNVYTNVVAYKNWIENNTTNATNIWAMKKYMIEKSFPTWFENIK